MKGGEYIMNKGFTKIGVVMALVVVLIGSFVMVSTTFANNNHRHHHHGQPTPTPTEEVTPTPTPTEEPTLTPDPCDQLEVKSDVVEDVDPCVTPTPTEEPGQPGNPPTFAGSSTEAPTCSDVKPGIVANIFVKPTGAKGELEIQWALPSGAEKAHIEYGLEQSAQHALLNTANDGNEVVKDLVSGQHYWFRVAGVNGCAVGDFSGWYDPLVP